MLTCAPPHRPTAHVEEFTPLTEDSLLFDGPRTTYGRIRVLHQIGAGSVGPVFRGEDPATRRPVVVKVLRVGLPPERVSIVATALAAARERLAPHPALCPMLDSGVHEAEPFVVSAFVDGESLDVALREYGPANITDALPRMRALADALDSAAASGVAHGSLHLRDIIVSPEHTVLTGIGIASVLERVGVRPPVRRPYCAPEIAQGNGVSPAGDQFALAAIAHEWLSGRRISGPGAEGFHLPGTSAAGTEAVAEVFCRALDELPDARFPTATAFIDALAEVSEALAPRTRMARRRATAVSEPRLAFDFLEDEAQPPSAAPPAEPSAAEVPAISFAVLDDSDVADTADQALAAAQPAELDDGPVAAFEANVVEDAHPMAGAIGAADVGQPLADALAAAADAHPMAGVVVPDEDEHPMADAIAAAELDIAAPMIDLPDDPGPRETAQPPVVVRPLGAPVTEPPAPPAPASYSTELADDEPATARSPARWAFVLMVLAALAVAGGAALVRWGTPSRTDEAQAAASAGPDPAAAPVPPPAASSSDAGVAPAAASGGEPSAALTPAAAAPAKAPALPPPAKAPAKTPAKTPAATNAAANNAAAGRLLVRSTPTGAEVFVDGARRGVTPLAVRDLPLGAHAVRITRAGFTAAEQRVTLDAGRPSRAIDVTLGRVAAAAPPVAASTPGSLVVESRPAGARVLVDGREIGSTPVTLPSLPAGDHGVRIELAGYQTITTTTRVEPGSRARVAVSLTIERQQ